MIRRVLVLVTMLLCVASISFARPGGGQSFRSSSGGGGSSGGGHSSTTYHPTSGPSFTPGVSSGSAGYTPGFCGQAFLLVGMILLVLVVVWVMSARSRRASGVRSAVLDAQADLQAASRRSVSLDAIRARDPNLTEASIIDRVRRMSDILRDAWVAGDMRPARPFMSDGTFSRFQVQLELMRGEGVRNVMSDTRVLYVTIEAVQTNPPLDIVSIRFTAEGRDATVPLNSTPQQIQAALAKTQVAPYTEIWTLVRRQGAQTKQSADSVGKACPSCGAAFQLAAPGDLGGGEIVSCKYCKALVCSGEHDWVLAEITQLSEWHPNSAEPVAGLDGLREVDLGVTRETLEDRASYLFWKWIESGRKQNAAPLRKAATPELIGRGPGPAGGWDGANVAQNARDIAVGGADLVLCDVARSGEPQDLAYVNVFWSAAFAPGTEPSPQQSTLRLARKSGASTKLSMTQVVCPNCGGPLVETDDPRCNHCGADIVATGLVWALDGVGAPGSARPRNPVGAAASIDFLVPDVRDPRERMVLFSQMAQMMMSGGLKRDEKRLIVECGKRWGIPEDVVGRALAGQLTGQVGPVASPEWFLAGLVAAALIDGTIDAQERDTLQRVCASLNLPPQVLEQQIAATQQRMAAQRPTA